MSTWLLFLGHVLGMMGIWRGDLMLHGALIARGDSGVILAGRGGSGKTTACERVPPPWEGLSDDAVLVVRDASGGYWAHPWPTWSRMLSNETGLKWPVRRAVRLQGVFWLTQAAGERIEPVNPAEASASVTKAAEFFARLLHRQAPRDAQRAIRSGIFDNACALARSVPSYRLHMSRHGPFWREIEKCLKLT